MNWIAFFFQERNGFLGWQSQSENSVRFHMVFHYLLDPMTDPSLCYIYGVPWIPSIYPLDVSIYIYIYYIYTIHGSYGYDFPMVFPWFSHGFPMVFPWFSHGFPMVFPWFSRGFPMVFPWFSHGFPLFGWRLDVGGLCPAPWRQHQGTFPSWKRRGLPFGSWWVTGKP